MAISEIVQKVNDENNKNKTNCGSGSRRSCRSDTDDRGIFYFPQFFRHEADPRERIQAAGGHGQALQQTLENAESAAETFAELCQCEQADECAVHGASEELRGSVLGLHDTRRDQNI